jgi:AraC-like DNA-binding protein
MQYQYQIPNTLLTEYIRTVLVLDGTAAATNNKLPLFTNGMPALVCKTAKNGKGIEKVIQLSLFGKSAPADSWEVKRGQTVIAYFFKPFTVACIFNLSIGQLIKAPLDLSLWDAHRINALKTQLSYAGTIAEKKEALDNLLLYQLQQQGNECKIIHYATDRIMINPGKEVLAEIKKDLGINERTLQRLFKKFVGITPNQYRRICQFQLSFNQLRSGRFINLTDVAFENGFADQSHFIRSFKEFTQTRPKEYLKSGLGGIKS